MSGEWGTPYRAPCGGWPATRRWAFGCRQHRVGDHETVDKYGNITRVPDYADPEDPDYQPGGIPPYPKDTGWADEDVVPNAFQLHESQKLNFSVCRKIGFKNVQARKVWHGRLGYWSHDPLGELDRRLGVEDGWPCDVEYEQVSPSTTKYLSMTISATWDAEFDGEEQHGAATHSGTVGRTTGVVSRSSTVEGDYSNIAEQIISDVSGYNKQSGYQWWAEAVAGWQLIYTVTATDGSGILFSATAMDGSYKMAESTYEVTTGNFNLKTYDHSSEFEIMELVSETDLSMSNTGFVYRYWTKSYPLGKSRPARTETTVATCSLGTPYTAAELYTEVKELLDEWDLSDDVVYPWRTDELVSVAPLVTRNEQPAPISPDASTGADPAAATYDGSILGSPLLAGYGPYFNYDHATYERIGGLATATKYGAYAGTVPDWDYERPNLFTPDVSDDAMPRTATQWTDNLTACDFHPCAWVRFDGDFIYAQKWAEIHIIYNSHNFARPCGEDRYLIDESTARCLVNSTPAPSATIELASESATIGVGTDVMVYGAQVPDGAYKIAQKTSATTYVLQDTALSVDVPELACVDGSLCAKIRFPTAPAICGRVAISSATQNGTEVELVTASETWLRTGDTVNISGVGGLGNGLAVEVTDPTHFTVTGTLVGTYSSGGYVTSPSAANYKWNDNNRKGDYLVAQWVHDFRDYQERDRVIAQHEACESALLEDPTVIREHQETYGMPRSVAGFAVTPDCLTLEPCVPGVICISPNGEAFANGNTYSFPTEFVADNRYNSLWQADVRQRIDDPLYEARVNCATECSDRADFVEARNGIPAGAPALPTGITLEYATLAELNTGSAPTKNVWPPPGIVGEMADACLPRAVVTPWGDMLRGYGGS